MTHPAPQRLTPPDISLRAITKLASPIFIANVAIVGGGTVDTIMAGHLGADHLAAIAVGLASVIMVFMGLVGILQGMSPLAGHHFGGRRYEKIGFELSQCLWLAAFLSIIGIALMCWTDLWMELSQAQGEVRRMATEYILISALGLPPSLFGRAFVSLNAAVSRPKVTMYVSLANLALKVPLNAVFMYGWLGFEPMGGAGAAVSSMILSWIALFAYIIIWKKDSYYDKMRCSRFYGPQLRAMWEQLKIGVPIGLSTFFEVSSFTLMAIFISRFGPVDVSAHQIVANVTSLCYMIALSIGIACTVLVSQCLGAGYAEVAEKATRRCLISATSLALIVAFSLYFGRGAILALYTSDETVIKIAYSLILFGVFYHVFDALQCVGAFALRGYRVTFWPMVIYGVLLWCVGLFGGYYMAFYGGSFGRPLQAYGFWGMTATGLFLAGSCLATMALFVARVKTKESQA